MSHDKKTLLVCTQSCMKCFLHSDSNVTYEVFTENDECVLEVVNTMQPEMLQHVVMLNLLPYMNKYDILTINEVQKLQLESTTNYEKVNCLLSSILVHKSPEGKKHFIIALYESSKKPGNSGHKKLIDKLQHKGLKIVELPVDSTNNPSAISDATLPS